MGLCRGAGHVFTRCPSHTFQLVAIAALCWVPAIAAYLLVKRKGP